MANGPALSSANGGETYVGSEFRESFPLLDVLYANEFEGKSLDPDILEQTEVNFYRGAPPQWLNFHITEQLGSNGTGSPFIKRDGYDTLVEQINQQIIRPGTSTVKLFHQPGSGGTTLAMQVLWDLRKTFRCAVLTGPTSDLSNVAKELVHLFTAGDRGHQNTVLLLVNDEHILENLQDSIMKRMAEMQMNTYKHVAVLLSCVRKEKVIPGEHVSLKLLLSDTEEQQFHKKKEELSKRFTTEHTQFHGFNIMQSNFSQDYVKQRCKVFFKVQRRNRPKSTQLAAFLSLLNAYAPGSYLQESDCLYFFKHDSSIHGNLSLEDRMKSFHHLIVFFQQGASERRVRMAHHLIAQQCIEQMTEVHVTRSDTAKNFLNYFCRGGVPACLSGFVKDMLTKREMKKEENLGSTDMTDEQERFSRLILDIQKTEHEGALLSASVLKVASKIFDKNPYFPQALARVYYIELKYYDDAEHWAEEAKKRDPQNSFIADTLGQVYKNHLNYLSKGSPVTLGDILQLASKAIEAFKHEERLAENERGPEMKGDGMAKVSRVFNARGQFGYLQVCNVLFDFLVKQNKSWRRVLTGKSSALKSLGDDEICTFDDLISSLRDEVERKYAFYEKYLTYSKPNMNRDDASYVSDDISVCYKKYVGESPPKHVKEKCAVQVQKLKQRLAETSAGVLSCPDREYTESELKEITTWWEEIYSNTYSLTALGNYFLAHIVSLNMGTDFPSKSKYFTTFKQKIHLIPKEAPELHMLALLLHWPTDSQDKCNLSELVENMHSSYELTYKQYFRSRYLRPLFFIGKGQGLKRIVHRRVLEGLFLGPNNGEIQDWSNWSEDKIFKDPKIQTRLLRVEGVVRNYSLYVTINGREIKVDANTRNGLWKTRQVSFYLGFNIKGPVAFGIQTKPIKVDKKQVPVVISPNNKLEPDDKHEQ